MRKFVKTSITSKITSPNSLKNLITRDRERTNSFSSSTYWRSKASQSLTCTTNECVMCQQVASTATSKTTIVRWISFCKKKSSRRKKSSWAKLSRRQVWEAEIYLMNFLRHMNNRFRRRMGHKLMFKQSRCGSFILKRGRGIRMSRLCGRIKSKKSEKFDFHLFFFILIK